MTASRARRARSTWIALGLTVVALVLAGALTITGARTLADSKAGRLADGQRAVIPSQRLPFTPTALVGTVDDTGRLTSVVVMVVEPDGTGGSIVELAASADANSGNTKQLLPLSAVLEVDGPDELRGAVETLTSLSFDVVELVDQERFAQIVSPLGDLPVELPITVYDTSTGEQWAAGDDVLPGAEAARVVTATAPEVADHLFEPARAAVWSAVASRVGAGIGSAEPVASDADLPQPSTLAEVLDRLFAGPVHFRSLPIRAIKESRVDEQLAPEYADAFGVAATRVVTVHDRSEVLMVMGSIAPGRMGAPLEAPSFRVVSAFGDADLEAVGLRDSDVLKRTIDRLLFAKVNIVSVAELPALGVPEHSVFVVADPSLIDGVRDKYEGTFGGDIDVRAADVLIEGVDIELIIGRDFLDRLATDGAPDVESSATNGSSGTSDG